MIELRRDLRREIRTSAGALVQGVEENFQRQVIRVVPELTTDIEDALLLSV